MRRKNDLTGLTPRHIDEIFDHPARGDWVQAILNLLDENQCVVSRCLNFGDDPDDAGLPSPEMKLGILLPAFGAASKEADAALLIDIQFRVAGDRLAKDFLDLLGNLIGKNISSFSLLKYVQCSRQPTPLGLRA